MTSEHEQEPIEMVDRRRARMAAEAAGANGEAPADTDAPAADAADESADLTAEREKADTYYKNWQRSAADFINYKRRVEQDRSANARLANAAMVINILPVFDDFDRAVGTVDANLAGLNWVQGSRCHSSKVRPTAGFDGRDRGFSSRRAVRPRANTRPLARRRARKARSSMWSRRATPSATTSSGPPWSSSDRGRDNELRRQAATPARNRKTHQHYRCHRPDGPQQATRS